MGRINCIKDGLNITKNKLANTCQKAIVATDSAIIGLQLRGVPVFATTETPSKDGTQGDAMMSKLLGIMCAMFNYVGIGILAWGIIQFILATKRSDADSKADAIQTAVCGMALMGVSTIVNTITGKQVTSVTI